MPIGHPQFGGKIDYMLHSAVVNKLFAVLRDGESLYAIHEKQDDQLSDALDDTDSSDDEPCLLYTSPSPRD